MKKLFPKDPAETRRHQLNQSATDLAKRDRFPGDSEHRRLFDAKMKARRAGLLLLIIAGQLAISHLAIEALDPQPAPIPTIGTPNAKTPSPQRLAEIQPAALRTSAPFAPLR